MISRHPHGCGIMLEGPPAYNLTSTARLDLKPALLKLALLKLSTRHWGSVWPGRPPLTPQTVAHSDILSEVETLWLRWVASAVVGVTTDLRHTDSRGELHDQSSGRRHLSNPPSRDSPVCVHAHGKCHYQYISQELIRSSGNGRLKSGIWLGQQRPSESVRRGMDNRA